MEDLLKDVTKVLNLVISGIPSILIGIFTIVKGADNMF